MILAFSHLKRLLAERALSIPELHRRIEGAGMGVNVKSLYRLSSEHRPLERLDLRVAGMICHVCKVPLSDLISFENGHGKLRRFSAAKQKRLDVLMTRNNDGDLGRAELLELKALVREAEEMNLKNARVLARQKQQLMPI